MPKQKAIKEMYNTRDTRNSLDKKSLSSANSRRMNTRSFGRMRGGANGDETSAVNPIPEEAPKELPADNPVGNDVTTMVKDINKYLEEWNQKGDTSPATVDKLTINGTEYSVECMLNNFIGQNKFTECHEVTANFVDDLDVQNLLTGDIDKDTIFLKNLVGFNMAISKFISSNPGEMGKLSIGERHRMYFAFREFIKKNLEYLKGYMDKYNIIDGNLINDGYILLNLLNKSTKDQSELGTNTEVLQKLRDQVIKAVKENISMYNDIIAKNQIPEIGKEAWDEVEKTLTSLEERVKMLGDQKQELETLSTNPTELETKIERV